MVCVYTFWRAGAAGGAPKHLRRRWALLALAVVFAFGAGEEISWGQRLLGFATPDAVEAVNVQGEFTLHNLEAYGINAVSLTRRLFHLFWFTLTVVIPVGAALSERLRGALGRIMPIPPWWVGVPFVLNYALVRGSMLATRATYQSYHYAPNEIQEGVFEVLFLALAVLLATRMLRPLSRTAAPARLQPG